MVRRYLGVIQNLDPRYFQITILGLLLFYGVTFLGFEITIERCLIFISSTLFWQWVFTFLTCKYKKIIINQDLKSALISSLSMCLLVRTDQILWIILIPFLTVAMKFLIRTNDKHIYNPTNIAIVTMLIFDGGWISPGQWGNEAFFAFLFACLGMLVVYRSMRADVALSFIFFWCVLIFGRSWMLGEPLAIPIHRIESGSILLFSFFMISDPKTTPNSQWGRYLFALLVALGAYYIQFKIFRTNGLIWSLAFWSTLVPIIDLIFKGQKYSWPTELLFNKLNKQLN